MYISAPNLSDIQDIQPNRLAEALKKHIKENGSAEVELRIEENRQQLDRSLVIIGENHSAATRTVDLARRLMKNYVYRFVASELFFNAGPLRIEIRDFMRGFRTSLGHILCPYETLLRDLKSQPRYILFMGSRAEGTDIRDQSLARHFLEEFEDRKLHRTTPGILICGGNHAARVAGEGQRKPTRRWLEEAGLKILGAMLATDDMDGSNRLKGINLRTDTVWPIGEIQTPSNAIPLLDLVTTTTEYTVIPTKNSPFDSVTDVWGEVSSVSVAERYELVILAKSMQRCKR